MHQVKYGLFFDNHTQFEIPDVGKDFDAEYFTDRVKDCGADYLVIHARCNCGMAYYDTGIGTRHPALKYDLFGQVAECCRKKGIALVAYLNGGISTFETLRHPEWATRYMPGTDRYGKITPFATTVCYNSTFRDHIIAMIREIAAKYPVQGFFIDCILNYPCVCPKCSAAMRERGIDLADEAAVREFSRLSALEYCRAIAGAVRKMLPDPMLFFNGPVFGSARDLDTIFDCECLPTANWGYEFLPTMAHCMRNIKPGTQLLNMTGRFYDWGDFGGLRTAESLKFDLRYGLAHGMRPEIGGHMHPRGDRDDAVFDCIAGVYRDLRRYDRWYDGATNLADTAVVYPADDRELRRLPAVKSCVRMLEELKVQFDIVFADCEKPWDRYDLLILPEQVRLTERLVRRIREHLRRGGAFFACGGEAAKKLGAELGVSYRGDSGLDPVYFKMRGDLASGLPDMFLSLYAPASNAEATTAQVLSYLVKPYFNRAWATDHALYYTPPREETGMPFLTVNGRCIWCSGELFTGYFAKGATHLRDIFRNALSLLVEAPLIRAVSLPSFVRLVVTEQPGRMIIHLIAYAPEKRGNVTVVEDPAAVVDGSFAVRTAGKNFSRAYLAPDETPVEFSADGGYTSIRVPIFTGYAVIVLEE